MGASISKRNHLLVANRARDPLCRRAGHVFRLVIRATDWTSIIIKADVDWIWEHRMKSNFATFTNFIFDQLMANNGKLSYCIRWDSTNKLPKATAAKFKAMLDKQYAQWNKWLVGYGCWPFAQIELEIVGVDMLGLLITHVLFMGPGFN